MAPVPIHRAAVIVPTADLDADLAFFVEQLGFRLEEIFPADDPRVAQICGHGVRLRLERDSRGAAPHLRLLSEVAELPASQQRSPGGIVIEWRRTGPDPLPPERQSFSYVTAEEAGGWITGRAGMCYRDLIPGRQNGRFVASHIRIDTPGPVPDYVHAHQVRFQFIYCWRGWVRVVYEDQGAPFVLRAGDCVLQPPGIRHRVLESGPGLEVIEVGSPADHVTCAEHALELPNGRPRPDRTYGGQAFVRYEAARAGWRASRRDGLEISDTGMAEATGGLASVAVVRAAGHAPGVPLLRRHQGEFLFLVGLAGHAMLRADGDEYRLGSGDACAIPAGMNHGLGAWSDEFRILEVRMPADVKFEAMES